MGVEEDIALNLFRNQVELAWIGQIELLAFRLEVNRVGGPGSVREADDLDATTARVVGEQRCV